MKSLHLVIVLNLTFYQLFTQNQGENIFSGNPKDSIKAIEQLNTAKDIYRAQLYDSVVVLCDSLLAKSLQIKFIRGAGEACFLEARALNRLGRREKAIEMFVRALEYFMNIRDNSRIASTYNNLGILLKSGGSFREAIEAGEKALQHANQTSDNTLKFNILNNLGNSYQSLALFKKASNAYFEALNVLKLEQDGLYKSRMQAEVYINLGISYFDQKLYSRSLELYSDAENILVKQQLKPQLATLYNNMGITYIETGDYNLAKKYLDNSIRLNDELSNKIGTAINLDGFGNMYFKLQSYKKAIKMHNEAIISLEQLNAVSSLPSIYLGLGTAYLAVKDVDSAFISLMKGLQIALKSGQKINELQLYEGLIEFYKNANELEMALMYYDLHSALSHELNDQQIGRHIGQLELKELLDKRDLALQSLELETASLQFQVSRQNTLLLLSISLILVISAVFGLLFRQQRLKSLNKRINLEQKILRAQLNPHFIFNALGAIQHYISSRSADRAAIYLSKFSKLMRAVLENSRTKTTSLSSELETLSNYIDLQSLRFSGAFQYHIKVEEGIETELIHVPSLIIQPLVENAIEHGLIPKGGGELIIQVKQVMNRLEILVEDNGIGLANSSAQIKRLSHTGLGTAITRERLALFSRKKKKDIYFELFDKATRDPNNNGTKAIIKIPIY